MGEVTLEFIATQLRKILDEQRAARIELTAIKDELKKIGGELTEINVSLRVNQINWEDINRRVNMLEER